MRQGGAKFDTWLAEIAAEYPDEEWLQPANDNEEIEFEPKPWHDLYFRAWDAIRYDRFYGAMGGETPIGYMVISQYAHDHDIRGNDFLMFETFMAVLDSEHLDMVEKRAKKDSES